MYAATPSAIHMFVRICLLQNYIPSDIDNKLNRKHIAMTLVFQHVLYQVSEQYKSDKSPTIRLKMFVFLFAYI